MKILVIGSGGREHALVWKIARSCGVSKIFCAPGNGGISHLAECVDIKSDDLNRIFAFVKEKKIDLTVVGPEAPLVTGIVDKFEGAGLKIFGPARAAARLEESKSFAKEIMKDCGVPTADFEVCRSMAEVRAGLGRLRPPVVVKADGLAQGKGVVICATHEEALKAAGAMLEDKIFGRSGEVVLLEERLEGEEASILVLTDGRTCVPLAPSQDHKRVFDGDEGPNTGGMGAYSPAPVVTEPILTEVMGKIVEPVVRGMSAKGSPYRGILYAGIMVTKEGPKVLEFNVRFGDPETQAVLMRLDSDLVEAMLWTVSDGAQQRPQMKWSKSASVCVVVSSGGYPGPYEKGKEIFGLDDAEKSRDVMVFHAGTQKISSVPLPASFFLLPSEQVRYVTDGGRVLGVAALGATVAEAAEKVYRAVSRIHFDGMHYRRDIGRRAFLNS